MPKTTIAAHNAPQTVSSSPQQTLQPNVELLAQIHISVTLLPIYAKIDILSVHLVLERLEQNARPEQLKTQCLNLKGVVNEFEILGFG